MGCFERIRRSVVTTASIAGLTTMNVIGCINFSPPFGSRLTSRKIIKESFNKKVTPLDLTIPIVGDSGSKLLFLAVQVEENLGLHLLSSKHGDT